MVNYELGAALSEGRMWAGDRQYHLTDLNNNPVLDFYVSEQIDQDFAKSAPPGTNYAAKIVVDGLNALKTRSALEIGKISFSKNELLDVIRDSIIASVGAYDLGEPKYVLVQFIDFID